MTVADLAAKVSGIELMMRWEAGSMARVRSGGRTAAIVRLGGACPVCSPASAERGARRGA